MFPDPKRDQEATSPEWRDLEKVVPECSGRKISQIFSGKIQFQGNGIRERRPLIEVFPTGGGGVGGVR